MKNADDYLNASDKLLEFAIEGLMRVFDIDWDFLNLSLVVDLNDKTQDYIFYNRYNIYDGFKYKTPPFAVVEPKYAEAVAIALTSISFFDFIAESRQEESCLYGMSYEELEECFLKSDHQQYYSGADYMTVTEGFHLDTDEEGLVVDDQLDKNVIDIASSLTISAIKKYRESRVQISNIA